MKRIWVELKFRVILLLFSLNKMTSKSYVNHLLILFIGCPAAPIPKGVQEYARLIGNNPDFAEEEEEIRKCVKAVVIVSNHIKQNRTILKKHIVVKREIAENPWTVLTCILFLYHRKFGRDKLLRLFDKLNTLNSEEFAALKEYFQTEVIRLQH